MRRLLILALLGLSLPATAAEYRRITVNDGRVLIAEVADTTDTGLRLVLHQGRTLVAFQDVVNLEDVDVSTWDSQEDWQLIVVPPKPQDLQRAPELQETLTAAAAGIPASTPLRPADVTTLSVTDRGRLANCGTDSGCVQGYLDKSGADVLVAARVQGPADAPEIVVTATYATAPRAWREVAFDRPSGAGSYAGVMRQAIETALHLDPRPAGLTAADGLGPGALPDAAQPPTTPGALPDAEPEQAPGALPTADASSSEPAPPDPAPVQDLTDLDKPAGAPMGGPSRSTLRALSWVPLPGTPSLARGDWGGFAGSMGVVVPGTAAMVYVAGKASFSREQLIATGAGSFYVLTVAMNKAFGLRGLGGELAVQPLPGGGLVLGLQGPLGGNKR